MDNYCAFSGVCHCGWHRRASFYCESNCRVIPIHIDFDSELILLITLVIMKFYVNVLFLLVSAIYPILFAGADFAFPWSSALSSLTFCVD